MLKHFIRVVLFVLLPFTLPADVVFSSGFQNPTNYVIETRVLGSGGRLELTNHVDENSLDFRIVLNAAQNNEIPRVEAYAFNTNWAYDPKLLGAFHSIAVSSTSFMVAETDGQAGAPAFRQGTNIFVMSNYDNIYQITNLAPFTFSTNLWSTYWVDPITGHRPDFSTNGLPIYLGLVRRGAGGTNSSLQSSRTRTTELSYVVINSGPTLVAVGHTGAQSQIRFQSWKGAVYVLERKASIASGLWETVGTVQGTGSVVAVDLQALIPGFFRVRLSTGQ